jgi:hypothetical protein
MSIIRVGIDLAKNAFAVHGVDDNGKAALVKPRVSREQLPSLIAQLPPCAIGMEACSGAHHWPRLPDQSPPPAGNAGYATLRRHSPAGDSASRLRVGSGVEQQKGVTHVSGLICYRCPRSLSGPADFDFAVLSNAIS